MEASHSRYRIVSAIGRGGMGTVQMAEDTVLHRRVALKFLTSSASDDASARRRLLREAQAAARLDHPFVCKVYEVAEGEGVPFIAMEYLDGSTLKSRLARGPLPLPEALRIAGEIAEAMECAQEHAVVHRDLKPANVMLTRDGHVRVMDFGIAQLTAPDDTTETMEAHGGLAGTLTYMSPEQLRGETLDSRSDIFAFGIVLFEMLTGRHPFARATAVESAQAILGQPPPRIADAMADPPAALELLVQRLLARDRGERYPTFTEVRRAMSSITSGGAVPEARPASRARRALRTLLAAAALIALAALGIRFLPAWLHRPALAFNRRDWIVLSDVENLTGDPVFDRSLSLALNVSLSQSRYVNILPQSRVREALQRMQRPRDAKLDEALACELAVREGAKGVVACSIAQVGSVYELMARLIDPQTRAPVSTRSVRVDRKDAVLPALDRLGAQVRRTLGESLAGMSGGQLPLAQATTASLDALRLYTDAGRAPDVDSSRRLLEEAVGLDPDFAMAHARLGASYYLQTDQAARMKGEQHLRKALGLEDRLTFRERLMITALAEDSRGNREQAVLAFKELLAAYPDDQEGWFRLGWTYMAGLQAYSPAVDAFRHVIAIDPEATGALVNLATCLAGLGRDAEARTTYERAFALTPEQMLGTFVNNEYGFTLVRLGDLDGAREVFEKMAAQTDAQKRAKGLRSLALLEMYRGHYRAATALLRQAIQTEHPLPDGQVSEFRDRVFLVNSLSARGRTAELQPELRALEALISRMALSPEWGQYAVKLFVRIGWTRTARDVVAAMARNAGNPTNDSSTNRNTERDQAYLDVARGEVELAAGHADRAIGLIESAHHLDAAEDERLASLAGAYVAAGRREDAARAYATIVADRPLGGEAQEAWFDAQLRLAEIRGQQGDAADARALYHAVLALWKDADPDLIALQQARRGFAALR